MRYGLALPSGVGESIAEEEVVDRHLQKTHALARALKALDPQIVGITFFKPDAPSVIQTEAGPAVIKPGRWHVQRLNTPPSPPSFLAIETPSGGYREPDFGVLNELQRSDLQNRGGVTPEAKATPDDHRDEMLSDYRAAKRVAGDDVHKRKWGKG